MPSTTGSPRTWQSQGDTAAIADGRVVSEYFPGELRVVSLADGSTEWEIRSEYFNENLESDAEPGYVRPGFDVGAVTPDRVVYRLSPASDYPARLQARDLDTGDLLWDVGPEPTPVEAHAYSRPGPSGTGSWTRLAGAHSHRSSPTAPSSFGRRSGWSPTPDPRGVSAPPGQ